MSNFTFPPPPPPPPSNSTSAADTERFPNHGFVQQIGRGRGRGRGDYRGRGKAPLRQGLPGRSYGGHISQDTDAPISRVTSHRHPESMTGSFSQIPHAAQASFDPVKRGFNVSQSNSHMNKRPRLEVAPAVPSFGEPLPSIRSSASTANTPDSLKTDSSKKQKPKKTNQLGLTPKGADHEASDDDADEEARFVASLNNPLQIEYRGKISVLGSKADLAAWIEERKKRWPTKARVEAKKAEEAKRRTETAEQWRQAREARQIEIESARKQDREKQLANARQKVLDSCSKTERSTVETPANGSVQAATTRISTEPLIAKTEEAYHASRKSQEKLDQADAARSVAGVANGNVSTPAIDEVALSGPTVDYSLSEDDLSNNGSISDSSLPSSLSRELSDTKSASAASSAGPDEITSRLTEHGEPLPSSARARSAQRLCHTFVRTGTCRYGTQCHYRHERPTKDPVAGRTTERRERHTEQARRKTTSLYQRMVEQEQDEENRVILSMIKKLFEQGFQDGEHAG